MAAPNLYATLPPTKRRKLVKALFTVDIQAALNPLRFFGGFREMRRAVARTPGVSEEEAREMLGGPYFGLSQVCIRFDLPAAFPNSRSICYSVDGEYMGVDVD